MATTHGSTQFTTDGFITLVAIQTANDPYGGGPAWEYTYTGTPSGIDTLAANLSALGVRYRTSMAAGEPVLIATYTGTNLGGDPSTETPTDSWGFDTEAVNVSLFSHPKATHEANTYVNYALYKKDIEDALAAGASKPPMYNPVGPIYPFSNTIYTGLARGQDYFEMRRPVLKRARTVSFQYTDKMIIDALQRVWTTATLITDYAIPGDVAARLPADPAPAATPYGTAWAWMLTIDTSEYSPALRRWTEMKQWVFAAWDPAWYTIL